MQKSRNASADEVRYWPLILGVVLLVGGAILYKRLGNDRIAMALALLAVFTPLVGLVLRSILSRPQQQPVRRVVVNEGPSPISTIPLESAKYRTPPSKPGIYAAADEAAAKEWLRGSAKCS